MPELAPATRSEFARPMMSLFDHLSILFIVLFHLYKSYKRKKTHYFDDTELGDWERPSRLGCSLRTCKSRQRLSVKVWSQILHFNFTLRSSSLFAPFSCCFLEICFFLSSLLRLNSRYEWKMRQCLSRWSSYGVLYSILHNLQNGNGGGNVYPCCWAEIVNTRGI